MKLISTRNPNVQATVSEALRRGIAPDGGLYVPETLPSLTLAAFPKTNDLPVLAHAFLTPFFAGDPLASQLRDIVQEAFDFPVPLVRLATPQDVSLLELFHGPTAAFKDFGARFLAGCLARLHQKSERTLTILVATSGDTGGAVAAAFHNRPGIEVIVLYPRGLVSPRQEMQLTCWGGNITSCSVEGTFDDCQRLVKEAFADKTVAAHRELSSANSINIGRLLPQACYYVQSSLATYRRTGELANYIVPSGNLGNVLSCVWARRVGLPIGEIVMAFNENRTVTDYLSSGQWQPRASLATLASAMDVGNPSNMERLRHLHPEWRALIDQVSGMSVSDSEIKARIQIAERTLKQTLCPHTACAADVYERLTVTQRAKPWIWVATAHPAKFPETVEPLVGHEVEVPPSLARLLSLPKQVTEIKAELSALKAVLA
jgi:threonine synthase